MSSTPAVDVAKLSHRYGNRLALNALSLAVREAEVFALLGPNGGGKTTLFRVLSTLVPPQDGTVHIFGLHVRRCPTEVRGLIGVVFQSPSLDKKLTVAENIACQAALYGVHGAELRQREQQLLQRLQIADRARDLVETLSGGLRRRVELAKCMIHRPRLLLLDEPSTGLDPGARSDLWKELENLRTQFGVTVVLTTHLLEEADKADRIAILNHGQLAALDTPAALRAEVGQATISIQTGQPDQLAAEIKARYGWESTVVDGSLRLEHAQGASAVAQLAEAFADRIDAITLGKPTLEDVFIAKTGHRFWTESGA